MKKRRGLTGGTGLIALLIVAALFHPGNGKPDKADNTGTSQISSVETENRDNSGTENNTSITADANSTLGNSGDTDQKDIVPGTQTSFQFESLPAFSGSPAVTINNGDPYFNSEDLSKARTSYETYGNHDSLNRCTSCIASVGKDLMPTGPRGEIGMIKPTGWHTVKYKNVEGHYLYNRCHLIGYQLTGENANESNLITGTRYMNVEGMEPYESRIASYVKSTGNHVLYRVTPIFTGNDLLSRGVLMEAESVEDGGGGIKFCVFCYNAQPGIEINYADGSSSGPEYN